MGRPVQIESGIGRTLFVDLLPVYWTQPGAGKDGGVTRDYKWSSYHFNAYGKHDEIILPHKQYQSLAKDKEQRCYQYRELFRNQINDNLLHEIHDSINHEWLLGNDRCRVRLGKPGRPKVEEGGESYGVY